MASGTIKNVINDSPRKFVGTRNEAYTDAGNVYGYIWGKVVWLSGWIRLRSDVTIGRTDKIVTGLPPAADNVNVIYFDQTTFDLGCLYIDKDTDRTSIVSGGYLQAGHIGHILNFAATYIMQ